MLVNLGNDCIWEVVSGNTDTENKAILRTKDTCNSKLAMTIPMDGFEQWYYDNLEDLQDATESQAKIIFAMRNWGQSNYKIERTGKVLFSQ